MIREIREGPSAFKKTLEANRGGFEEVINALGKKSRVIVTACGTSYHAGLVLAYSISRVAGIASYAVQASEFVDYGRHLVGSDTLLVALSQSGETTDTIEAVKSVGKRVDVLAITNKEGSTLEKLARITIVTKAGEEKAVAATKTFVAQLAAVYGIVAGLEGRDYEHLVKVADTLAGFVNGVESRVSEVADKYKGYDDCFILGLGNSFVTSLEAALKLKETCGIHSEAYSIYEFRHGPISLEAPNVFNVFIEPMENERWKRVFERVVERVKEAGAGAIVIRPEGSKEALENFSYIDIPRVEELYSTVVQIIPVQFLAYYIAVKKGLNPDSPKFLTKVVSG